MSDIRNRYRLIVICYWKDRRLPFSANRAEAFRVGRWMFLLRFPYGATSERLPRRSLEVTPLLSYLLPVISRKF